MMTMGNGIHHHKRYGMNDGSPEATETNLGAAVAAKPTTARGGILFAHDVAPKSSWLRQLRTTAHRLRVIMVLVAVAVVTNVSTLDMSQYMVDESIIDLTSIPSEALNTTAQSSAPARSSSQPEIVPPSISVGSQRQVRPQPQQQQQNWNNDTSRNSHRPFTSRLRDKQPRKQPRKKITLAKAVAIYQHMTHVATDLSSQLDTQCAADPNTAATLSKIILPAFDCLSKTSSTMTHDSLVYPIADAHAHFNQIRVTLLEWAQHQKHKYHRAARHKGPWIENHFISHFETLYDERIQSMLLSSPRREEPGLKQFCLFELFGPYIPIFIPWTDHWMRGPKKQPPGLWPKLRSILRPDVPYIVVSQNDDGLLATYPNLSMSDIPNVLVLSAGGYGHVPIPLFKQTEAPLLNRTFPPPTQNPDEDKEERPFRKDPTNRTYVTSYVGSQSNSPMDMRRQMIGRLQRLDPDPEARAINNSTLKIFTSFYGSAWRDIMADSCFSFCPRGYGRTSYHVMETLQMGLIPIQVYLDIPWIPYIDLMEREEMIITIKHGFVDKFMRETLLTSLSSPSVAAQNKSWTFEKIREAEQRILSYRQSHFTPEGAMNQIQAFMLDPSTSDLRCQKLPKTPRGDFLL